MKRSRQVLPLTPVASAPEPPPDRGQLLDAHQVAAGIFHGQVSAVWVKRNVVAGRVRLGHSTVRWWEHDVRVWLEERTQQQAG